MESSDDILQKAIALATECHKGQMRSSGDPYITHPIAVMNILKECGFPPLAQAMAVLHDVCEDTEMTNVRMSEEFPKRVAFVVYSLSKTLKPEDNEEWRAEFKQAKKRKEQNTDSFEAYFDYRMTLYMRKFYLGCIADPYVMYIKMADQIHNLSDMESLSEGKKERKRKEVFDHFLPLYEKMEELVTRDCTDQYYYLMGELKKVLNGEKRN